MRIKYIVRSIFDDAWFKNEAFDTKDEAMQSYRHLLNTRLEDITKIEVVRQEWNGFECKETTIIKDIL